MTTTAPRRSPREQRPDQDSRPPAAVVAVQRLFSAETPEYFMLLGTTLFLVVFGLVMVLSSSSIDSYTTHDKDFFATATRQGLYALIGLPLMLVAARMPTAFWRRWAWVAILGATGLQLLVFTPLGYDVGGNRNWIHLGSFTAQPSELIKLALAIWIASILASHPERLDDWRRLIVPLVPVAGIAIGLVLLGRDLGTAMIMIGVVLAALFYAGVRLRYLGAVVAFAAVASFVVINVGSSRSDRIHAWLSGCQDQALSLTYCYQTVGGWQALAHGGIVGVGLGNSTAKWNWLPEAANDFIFAVIGEELGLVGAVLVLVLFVALAIAFVRIVRMSTDPFARIVVGAISFWIVGQAFVNIAVVLGLLPVFGVPLPLISAGGSSLLSTMAAIGVALSFARHRPEPLPVAPLRPARSGRPAAR
ncbi:putative lipid II flippase FtsW [Pseudolysinimonas sp.]|uniref:putative lipid II flippase FtsW n=1 Tax=Pseudolysinimonas sp. TaxID=2680009 RepID=UPI003F80817E